MHFEDKNLMDRFAETALTLLLGGDNAWTCPDALSIESYEIAGAMMEARQKKQNQMDMMATINKRDDSILRSPPAHDGAMMEARQKKQNQGILRGPSVNIRSGHYGGPLNDNFNPELPPGSCVDLGNDQNDLMDNALSELLEASGANIITIDSGEAMEEFLNGLELCEDGADLKDLLDRTSRKNHH